MEIVPCLKKSSNYNQLSMDRWDRYDPFLLVKKCEFSFSPSRFEVWSDGNMVFSGNSSTPINVRIVEKFGSEVMLVSLPEEKLRQEILEEIIFDEFVTSLDRLKLVTIPKETFTECVGLMTMRILYGPTCQMKNFHPKEPYCCNIFKENDLIKKITFSFSFPERLLEFHL